MKSSSDEVLEVAVIGAGPAGIIAAKQLGDVCGFSLLKPCHDRPLDKSKSSCHDSETEDSNNKGLIAVFEETCSVGGVWTRDPKRQRLPVPCSCIDSDDTAKQRITIPASSEPIYEYLRANFPKDLTSFTDHPFPSHIGFFPTPEEVATYYQGYARLHGLEDSIHFCTRVVKCWEDDKSLTGENKSWNIQVERTDEDGKNKQYLVFKSRRILVCTGHFRSAYVPDVRGLRHFRGDIKHASAFRTPEEKCYNNKSILIVGGGISGKDIANVLDKYGNCKRIVVSIRQWNAFHKVTFKRIRNKQHPVTVRPGIHQILGDGSVIFEQASSQNGHTSGGWCDHGILKPEMFDAIVFATGYRYWYPFLPKGGKYISYDGYKMNRLYMRILHIDDPSLAFIGVTNFNISPAIMLEYQSKWYAKRVVEENMKGFNPVEMEQEAELHDSDGTQDKLLFQFPSYCNSLATMTGDRGYWKQLLFLRLPWHIKSLWVRRHSSIYLAMALGVIGPGVLFTIHGMAHRQRHITFHGRN